MKFKILLYLTCVLSLPTQHILTMDYEYTSEEVDPTRPERGSRVEENEALKASKARTTSSPEEEAITSADTQGLYDANEKIQEILRTVGSRSALSQAELESTIVSAADVLADTMIPQVESAMKSLTRNPATKTAAHEYLAKLEIVKQDIARMKSRASTDVGGTHEGSGNVEELQYQNNIVTFIEATAELATSLQSSGRYSPSFLTPEFVSHMQNIYLVIEDSSRILQAKTFTRITPKKFKEIKNRAIVMNESMQKMFQSMEESAFMKMAFGSDGYIDKVKTIWQDAFSHIQHEERAGFISNSLTILKSLLHSCFVTVMYVLKVVLYAIPYLILGTAAIVQSRHSEGQHVGSGTFAKLYEAAEKSGEVSGTRSTVRSGGLTLDPSQHDTTALTTDSGEVDDGRSATDPQDLYSENPDIKKVLRRLSSRTRLSSSQLEDTIKDATDSIIAKDGTLEKMEQFISNFIAENPDANYGEELMKLRERLTTIKEDIARLQTAAAKQSKIQEGQYLDNIVSLVESFNDFVTKTDTSISPEMLQNLQTTYHTIEDATRVLQAKTFGRVMPGKITEIKNRFMNMHSKLEDFHDRIKDSTFMQFAYGSDGYLSKVSEIWKDWNDALQDERNSTAAKVGKAVVATGYTALVTVMYILRVVMLVLPYAIMGVASVAQSFHNDPYHVTSGTWQSLAGRSGLSHPVDAPTASQPHPDRPVTSKSGLFVGATPEVTRPTAPRKLQPTSPGNPFV